MDNSIEKDYIEKQYELNEDGTYSDLPRSNMPIAKDNINEMQDITYDLVPARDEFYKYMEAGDLTNATNVINNNSNLLSCLFNADKYNSLRDPIVALERLFLDDIDKYIMNLSEPQGEWQEDKEYKKYQVVSYIYDDATQFYAASQMVVPSNSTSEFNTNPTNTFYWTPVTLRGKQGYSGTGLTPMGAWNKEKDYYNYIDETTNMPHVSFIYHQNILWQAVSNNINSEPTFIVEEGIYKSTNPNWEIIMVLNQAANTILMPYNETIADVINRIDNRTQLNLDDLINDGYKYSAVKISEEPLTWEEKAIDSSEQVYASKISKKISSNEWNLIYNCPTTEMNFTIKYIKDDNGNWKGEKI